MPAAFRLQRLRYSGFAVAAPAPTHVFEMGEGVPHAELRVRDEAELRGWLAYLERAGYPNSGRVDRHYFGPGYVRDPNDLVIELATDGPASPPTSPSRRSSSSRLAVSPRRVAQPLAFGGVR